MNQSPLNNRNSVTVSIAGDGYAPAYAYELRGDRQLPTTEVQLLNLESILPLKMVYVYFPAIVLKLTSRTQDRYGKLTNV
ncbi:hypothetical protein QT971_07745 [Microcoleus sp. herbarium19]|uniref:hypothetical protein n=1 Tax=unclassified Microcoleus TaxID=2642155 RepID=UPI002FD3E27A